MANACEFRVVAKPWFLAGCVSLAEAQFPFQFGSKSVCRSHSSDTGLPRDFTPSGTIGEYTVALTWTTN